MSTYVHTSVINMFVQIIETLNIQLYQYNLM